MANLMQFAAALLGNARIERALAKGEDPLEYSTSGAARKDAEHLIEFEDFVASPEYLFCATIGGVQKLSGIDADDVFWRTLLTAQKMYLEFMATETEREMVKKYNEFSEKLHAEMN